MLATPDATEAIQGILNAPGVPDSAGVRIVDEPQAAGGFEPVHRPGLQIMLAQAPAETDHVIDVSGARVFIDEPVAARLDDKLLDADIVADGVSFTIGQQAA